MSIRILANLQASPATVTLPATVDLLQRLASDKPSESVTVEYSLEEGNVYFASGAKTEIFDEVSVFQTGTAIDHRVSLIIGAGPATDQVEIDQLIRDADGGEQRDVTSVTIQATS
ncbi:MAG TPA: hypothetical protein VHQ90_03780 [Thermoanaerobaculia bacterium]|jgi:hypothetical protein|nr:hypothetical protein [Thermoanaerobaculia bacterium]